MTRTGGCRAAVTRFPWNAATDFAARALRLSLQSSGARRTARCDVASTRELAKRLARQRRKGSKPRPREVAGRTGAFRGDRARPQHSRAAPGMPATHIRATLAGGHPCTASEKHGLDAGAGTQSPLRTPRRRGSSPSANSSARRPFSTGATSRAPAHALGPLRTPATCVADNERTHAPTGARGQVIRQEARGSGRDSRRAPRVA